MKAIATGVLGVLLALPAPCLAHRLDEYLQATRIALARDHIDIEIDVTPGALIAGDITSRLDLDADGHISPLEAEAYGQAVLRDLQFNLDGVPVLLTLTRVEVPSIGEMSEGVGTIQILAIGRIPRIAPGRRSVVFVNNHHPDGSVYLANALVSADAGIEVVAQTRDVRQRQIRVDYEIRTTAVSPLAWSLVAVSLLATLVVFRKRSGQNARGTIVRFVESRRTQRW
jgi:nickel/cobalt transporter (NicO) family protein